MIVSLDELMEREYERETRDENELTQAWTAATLEELPDEGRWKPRDLVSLMRD